MARLEVPAGLVWPGMEGQHFAFMAIDARTGDGV
jgi:hypothetical protein